MKIISECHNKLYRHSGESRNPGSFQYVSKVLDPGFRRGDRLLYSRRESGKYLCQGALGSLKI
jgi:hypothetical protein